MGIEGEDRVTTTEAARDGGVVPGSEDPRREPAPRGPRLVVLRDLDARADVTEPCFGASLIHRTSAAARAAGFFETAIAPGVRAPSLPDRADHADHADHAAHFVREVAIGEPLGGAALVVHEGTWVDPEVLDLMVRHPLDDDEARSLYDEHGRPAAYFTGDLREVPALMPLAEEIEWPTGYGPHSIVRVVEPVDLERASWSLLLTRGELHDGGTRFERRIVLPTLRWLGRTELTVAQLELLALAACMLAVPVVLVLGWVGLVLGALLTLLGVHISRVLHPLRMLRGERGSPGGWAWIPGDTLARATRPLAHAAMTAALSYVLVAQTSRPALASAVLLGVGAAGALVSIAHARAILREHGHLALRLPRGDRFFARIDVALPPWLEGAPLLESLAVALALFGHPALPWVVFVGAAMGRSWRWFVGPERSYTPPQGSGGDDGASGNSSAVRRLTPS